MCSTPSSYVQPFPPEGREFRLTAKPHAVLVDDVALDYAVIQSAYRVELLRELCHGEHELNDPDRGLTGGGAALQELEREIVVFQKFEELVGKLNLHRDLRAVALDKGVKFGRPEIALSDNYAEVIDLWQSNKITAVEAMKCLNMKKTTFYKLARRLTNK